jgi:hypothetical protein
MPLTLHHPVHEDADRLRAREDDREEEEDLDPTVEGHVIDP